MKQLLIALLLCSTVAVKAQTVRSFNTASLIRPYNLKITWHKTTLLIFPEAIQSADRGDKYVLAEKAEGTDNVLKVKAGKEHFEQSNLNVITQDGKVYSFIINYSDNPPYQAIDLRKQSVRAPVKFTGQPFNQKQVADCISAVARQQPFLHSVKESAHKMQLQLDGIYIKNGVLFFSFLLRNKTQLKYDIDFIRFYIKDKKQAKRTAIQDKEITPTLLKVLPGKEKGRMRIVAAFKKFTIADSKYFITQVMEKDGDRNLTVKLTQRKLLKARSLSH